MRIDFSITLTFKFMCWKPSSSEIIVSIVGSQILQIGIDVNSLLTLLYIASVFGFIRYGRRLEMYIVANDVHRAVNWLQLRKYKSRKDAIDYFLSTGNHSG